MKYEDIAIPILKSLKWPIISKLNSSVCISALCEIKLPLSITPQQFLYIKLSWSPYYPITPCTDLLMHYSLWIILYNFQVLSAFLYLLMCVHSRPILTYLFPWVKTHHNQQLCHRLWNVRALENSKECLTRSSHKWEKHESNGCLSSYKLSGKFVVGPRYIIVFPNHLPLPIKYTS